MGINSAVQQTNFKVHSGGSKTCVCGLLAKMVAGQSLVIHDIFLFYRVFIVKISNMLYSLECFEKISDYEIIVPEYPRFERPT